MTHSLHERHWKPVIYTMIAAATLYLGFALWSGAEALGGSLAKVGFSGLSAMLILSLSNYALRFWRWQQYLNWLGYQVPPRQNIRFFLASFAFTATPGKLGEAVRSVFLKPFGVPYRSSLSALFVERLLDLTAALLFATLGILAFSRYSLWVALPLLVILLTLLLINNQNLQSLLRTRLPHRAAGFFDVLSAARVLSRGGPLVFGLLLSIIGWGCEALSLYLVLQFMGVDVPLSTSIGIYGLAITVGAVSFLPGGLGGTEAVMLLLLNLAGLSTADAGAATILFRFSTLWFAVILGLIILVGLERKRPTSLGTEKQNL